MVGGPWLAPLAALLVGGLAALTDMRSRIVPNRLSLAGVVLGLAIGAARDGAQGLLLSLFGMALAVAVYAGPWLAGGLGGGDLKLAAALGAIAGWPLAFPTLLAGAFAIALWSLGWAGWVRFATPGDAGAAGLGRLRVPQAPPLAAGAAAVLLLAAVR